MEVIYSITNVLDGLISASNIVEPLLPIYEDRKRKFNLIEVVIHDGCKYKPCHYDSVQENKSKDLICDMV